MKKFIYWLAGILVFVIAFGFITQLLAPKTPDIVENKEPENIETQGKESIIEDEEFTLPLPERVEVFREILEIEDKAGTEAEELFPINSTFGEKYYEVYLGAVKYDTRTEQEEYQRALSENSLKNSEKYEELVNKYHVELSDKYGITMEEFERIRNEQFENWIEK